MYLFLFGDSITYGASDPEGGWAWKLKQRYDRKAWATDFKFDVTTHPLGVSGHKSADVIDRFEAEIAARRSHADEEAMVLFAIGVNDAQVNVSDDSPTVSDRQFAESIDVLISRTRTLGGRPVFLGLTPGDQSKLDPVPWHPEIAYRSARTNQLNDALAAKCEQEGLTFIPLYERYQELADWKGTMPDGLHPGTVGHDFILKVVAEALDPLLGYSVGRK
jgi:lysophospholipase L1-like esterase